MSSENPLGGPTVTGPDGHVLHLPAPENPMASTYRKFIIDNGLLRTSTHFGTDVENKIVKGKVRRADAPSPAEGSLEYAGPADAPPVAANSTVHTLHSPQQAKALARGAGLRLVATLHKALDGDLSRVEQVIKLTGVVNGTADFETHGAVVDGCSEVLQEAFGKEKGTGARACSGAGSLGCVVTCDLEVRIKM